MKVNVEISFFEIYNEKIHDLLGPLTKDKYTGKRQTVRIYIDSLTFYMLICFKGKWNIYSETCL